MSAQIPNILIWLIFVIVVIIVLVVVLKLLIGVLFIIPIHQITATFTPYTESVSGLVPSSLMPLSL